MQTRHYTGKNPDTSPPGGKRPAPLVLASGSPYRRALLERLGLPFEVVVSDVDETPREGETPDELVARLSRAKARAVATRRPGALCIGSDQIAVHEGRVLGKPGDESRARAQLGAFSGGAVRFLTGLCLLRADPSFEACECVETTVRFRTLGADEIARYVAAERPLDCAGSFRAEGLGIALFESLESTDPTALIGLPLIRLAALLRRAGLNVP